MELLLTRRMPIQSSLPLPDLLPALPDPPPDSQIQPHDVWTTLTDLHREHLRQHLIVLLQEVLHATDHG